MRFLVWLVVNVAAVAAATYLVNGLAVTATERNERILTVVLVGVIFGVITSFIKPVVTFLSFPLILLTLGLFLLVINALLLMLTGAIAGGLDIGYRVDGFWSAVFGSIVISVVSWVVGGLFGTDSRARARG